MQSSSADSNDSSGGDQDDDGNDSFSQEPLPGQPTRTRLQNHLYSPSVTASQLLDDDSLHRIQKMVQLQANLNSQGDDGNTPLTKALLAKDTTKAKLLLDHGADPNTILPTGDTPLYMMACDGFLGGVILLVNNRADPNKTTAGGETPLYGAAVNGHLKCLEYLLQTGADLHATTENTGATALHGAASRGKVDCLNFLIQQGADFNKPNFGGISPLMAAAKHTGMNYIESLLDTTDEPLRSHETSMTRVTTINGYEECAKILVSKECAITEEIEIGQTPIVWAAKTGNCAWVEIFLEKGADPDKRSPSGETALFCAAEGGNFTCAQLLLMYNAKTDLTTVLGDTPLFEAATHGHDNIVELLLDHGADPDLVSHGVMDQATGTILSSLRWKDQSESNPDLNGQLSRIQLAQESSFIDSGFRNQAPSQFSKKSSLTGSGPVRQTPLYTAALHGHTECVKLLLAFDANPDVFTESDKENPGCGVARIETPLVAAVRGGNIDCIDLILDKAIPEVATSGGKLPLHVALDLRNEYAVEVLLSKGKVTNIEFFKHHDFSKRLFKESNSSFILFLLSSREIPWGAKQYLLERALKDAKDESDILRYIYATLEDLSRKSIEHQTIFLLMMDFYFYSAWIAAFAISAFNALNEFPTILPNIIMILLSFYFVVRELFELRRARRRYIKDIWNWVDIGAIIFVMITGVWQSWGGSLVNDGDRNNSAFQRMAMCAGAFITLSFVGYLKTTFLPFSNFVGGVTQILWDLFPFGIVTTIVLFCFSFMYYVQEFGDPGFETFENSFYSVFTRFLGEFDDASNMLDLFFGVVSVMILLNVVIAIVSTSWEHAVDKSLILLCRHRLELLQQVDAFVPKKGFSRFRYVPQQYDEDYKAYMEELILKFRRDFKRYHSAGDTPIEELEEDSTCGQDLLWFLVYVPMRAVLVVSPWIFGSITFGLLWPKHIREKLFNIVPDDKESAVIGASTTQPAARTSAANRRRSSIGTRPTLRTRPTAGERPTVAARPTFGERQTIQMSTKTKMNDGMLDALDEVKELLQDVKSDFFERKRIRSERQDGAPKFRHDGAPKFLRIEKALSSVRDEVKAMNEGMQQLREEMKLREDRVELLLQQLLQNQSRTAGAKSDPPTRIPSRRGQEVETEPLRPKLLDHGQSYAARSQSDRSPP